MMKLPAFKDKFPTEELDRHMAFQETICTQEVQTTSVIQGTLSLHN